jgi:hypothetical protein
MNPKTPGHPISALLVFFSQAHEVVRGDDEELRRCVLRRQKDKNEEMPWILHAWLNESEVFR